MNIIAQISSAADHLVSSPLFDSMAIRRGLGAGVLGGVLAFYHDLNCWLKSPDGTKWDWKKTVARVSAGFIGGAVTGLGYDLSQA